MYSKLRALMMENDITIDKVAKVLKVHRNTVANKLAGKTLFKVSELQEIRDTFFKGYKIDDLIGKVS